MKKRERVIAAIRLEPLAQTPSLFSFHFPKAQHHGEACINAHLNYFQESDTDIVKIMNENLLTAPFTIRRGEDYFKIGKIDQDHAFIQNQTTVVKQILDRYKGDGFTCGTLHGITASAIHPLENCGISYTTARKFICTLLRENKRKMVSQLEYICDALCILARIYVRAGLDGVYYASLGGEEGYFSDEEFEKYIKPLDLRIMNTIVSEGGYCILHICKHPIKISRYFGYEQYAHIINWGTHETGISLEQGREIYPERCILGGMANHDGVLAHGNTEEIRSVVQKLIQTFGRRGFILGADCTVNPGCNVKNIRTAVEAAREPC